MVFTDVCRLCMSDKELIWVFDNRFKSSDLKNVIMITTGVEVLQKDMISQKICSNCCKLTGKMYEFRERAVKTDKYLKERCKDLLKTCEQTFKLPNTSVSIKTEKKKEAIKINPVALENKISIKPILLTSPKSKLIEVEAIDLQPLEVKPTEDAAIKFKSKTHPSIDKIFASYENIKIPSACLKLNFDPYVSMEMNSVEDYFQRMNLDMKKHVQKTLRSLRASKKTSSKTKKKVLVDETNAGPNRDLLVPIPMEVDQRKSDNEGSDSTKNKPPKAKRRRLSSTDLITQPAITESVPENESNVKEVESEQLTLMDSLQLKPKENTVLHKCNICNIPKPSSKSLKQHYQEHFKCSYCKSKFKLFKRKEEHDLTCSFKHALTCKTYVQLERIVLETKTDENNVEIIELSDDEDEIVNVEDLSSPIVGVQAVQLEPQKSPSPPPELQLCSTGIVKPCIQIKDDCMFKAIDTSGPDLKILKELLFKSGAPIMKLSVDGEAQTTLPTNDQIVKDTVNITAKLKNLVSQIFVFRVPVEVKNGNFNISYKVYEKPDKKQVDSWTTIKPVELRPHSKFFNKTNLDTRLKQGVSLFAKTKINRKPPTILNHMINNFTKQPKSLNLMQQQVQASLNQTNKKMQNIISNQTSQNIQSHPTSNFNMQQQAQTSRNSPQNIQLPSLPQHIPNSTQYNLPQQIQTPIPNLQTSQFVDDNPLLTNQLNSAPQKIQTTTASLVQTGQLQSSNPSQLHILSKQIPPNVNFFQNVQMHNLPQPYVQTYNLPQQIQTGNIQNGGTYFQESINNQSCYVVQQNGTIFDVNSFGNSAPTQQNLVYANSTISTQHIDSALANNSPVLTTLLLDNSNAMSDIPSPVIGAPLLPSSSSKTPPPNMDIFGTTNIVDNSLIGKMAGGEQRPFIRVRNLCELK